MTLDGTALAPSFDVLHGSGHPTFHPDMRHILTDTYTFEEPSAFPDGTIPLRWIDTVERTERTLVRINTRQPAPDGTLRVDAHPAWDRSHRYVAFNAFLDSYRRVMVTDLADLPHTHKQ